MRWKEANTATVDLESYTVLDTIDKKTHEIKQDEDKVVYKSLEEIGDDLPDHSPRFVLLSYPLTLVCEPYLFPSSNLKEILLPMLTVLFISNSALWSALCTLRDAVLPPHNGEQRTAHDVRRCKRAHAEHKRGGQGH
jgi:hypothetical protein